MAKRPPWFWLRRLACCFVGHPWADEYGDQVRDGRSLTGSFCARCWKEF